jgi:hypothetical protein
MNEIKTPDCPRCGQPPAFTFLLPYFCRNDDCDVVSWEPTKTLAEIRGSEPQQIDVPWTREEIE